MIIMLSGLTPKTVFLTSVAHANRTTLSFHLGSEGKLYLIKNGGLGAPTPERMLSLTGYGQGSFIGLSTAGRGKAVELSQVGRAQRLCSRPAAAILNYVLCAALLHVAQLPGVLAHTCRTGTFDLKVRCIGLCLWQQWANETRLSIKVKKKG